MKNKLFPYQPRGFSLIEVLFAISFLILVGVAMASLNAVATRLTETAELKQIALGLNEQSLAFVALKKRTMGDTFAGETSPYKACIGGTTCYVVCPAGVSPSCPLELQTTKVALQIGTSKLQFVPSVIIRNVTDTPGRYLVNATTSWGKGAPKQLTMARIIE